MSFTILQADSHRIPLAAKSVQCVVTSPPYWGLRDYGTATWVGGDEGCDHVQRVMKPSAKSTLEDHGENGRSPYLDSLAGIPFKDLCGKCGATRIDSQIGLEPTPEAYVAKIVAVFAEVWRVLRDDGTLWLNLASSYCSAMIESNDYIIRRDFTKERRSQITQALSKVWSGHESAESAMQGLLEEGTSSTTELSNAVMSKMRQGIHATQSPDDKQAGDLLLAELREIRQPNAQESEADSSLPDVQQDVRQIQIGDEKESRDEQFLQPSMLVQLQPEGQPLSVGGRTGREDESDRCEVAANSIEAGQIPLSNLPYSEKVGSSSHQTFRNAPKNQMGNKQRDNPMLAMSPQIQTPGNGVRGDINIHGVSSGRGLEDLIFPKQTIPPEFLKFCEPKDTFKPKDEIDIPGIVCEALRREGWYRRATICWSKKNPMPESVSDRPTKSHEYIFLLTKKPNYYFDQDAVREQPADYERKGGTATYTADGFTTNGIGSKSMHQMSEAGRNIRTVWEIATQPYPEAHFATFPEEIAKRCIKAGTSERGACKECGAPWGRVTEREKPPDSAYNNVRVIEDSLVRGSPANHKQGKASGQKMQDWLDAHPAITTGWQPTCKHDAGTVPCIVLDPFSGAGTVPLVADKLNRRGIGLELKADYCRMANNRCYDDAPLFASG